MRIGGFLLLGLAVLVSPAMAKNFAVGVSDYRWLSELVVAGFDPFPSSGRAGELFGMKNSSDFYLCFSVDNDASAEKRWGQMAAEVDGGPAQRKVLNIPVACVLLR